MFHQTENGSIAIMAAFSLMMVIFITGMVYDFGSLFVTRSELQQAADTAAMAGGRALGAIYAGGDVDDGTQIVDEPRKMFSFHQAGDPGDSGKALIQSAVTDAAMDNTAIGIQINIGTNDIAVGTWDIVTSTFTPTTLPTNAVQVTTRRNQAAFFGQLANVMGYNVTATSTAALTPLQYVPPAAPPASLPPGQIILPLGIDQSLLTGNFCGNSILLSGDLVIQPCVSWTTYTNPANQANFNSIVAGTQTSPQTLAGNGGTSYFFGGPWTQQATGLQTIWQTINPPTWQQPWETLLPVHQDIGGACLATPQQIPIVGYVSVTIQTAQFTPQAQITFQCNVVGIGRSGDVNDPNLNYGTFGSVPVLVQ